MFFYCHGYLCGKMFGSLNSNFIQHIWENLFQCETKISVQRIHKLYVISKTISLIKIKQISSSCVVLTLKIVLYIVAFRVNHYSSQTKTRFESVTLFFMPLVHTVDELSLFFYFHTFPSTSWRSQSGFWFSLGNSINHQINENNGHAL